MKLLSTCLLFLMLTIANNSYAQSIQGQVFDEQGNSLPFANIIIQIDSNSWTALSDEKGAYKIEQLSLGNATIQVQYLGFEIATKSITLSDSKNYTVNFSLTPKTTTIKTLEVKAKSKDQELASSAYAVDLIATQAFKNINMDLNQLITKAPGIHIRSVGGLGSAFNLSLNGLSGNRVRYFIDGIPIENLGSALSLNNYPVNLIKNIEIFKGVVPIHLSADALGGAINLISEYKGKSFLDVSYSFGSFNTHRAAVNAQYSNLKKGFFISLNGFFNHSDNNYWMYDMPKYDELGNRVGDIDIQRFHDQYTSGMLQFKIGLLDKKFADELSLSFTGALNRKNYPHPNNNIKTTFGHLHSNNQTLSLYLVYKKSFGKVDISAYSQWSTVTETIVDTSHSKYNWAGEFWSRDLSSPRGELNERKSIFILNDKRINSNINVNYRVHPRHKLDLSISQNFLYRQGKDERDALRKSFTVPSHLHKNILGLAYTFNSKNQRFEATAFFKGYWFNSFVVTQDYNNDDVATNINSLFAGYAALATYRFPKMLRLKLSYEHAYRIPEPHELLGDGIYIRPNPNLLPESSHNINLGAYCQNQIGKFQLNYSLNGFYRNANNFIRFVPTGPFGTHENINLVGIWGAETSISASYNQQISISANATYQHITDETQFDEGLLNVNYQSRVPNVPYLFANFRVGYNLHLKAPKLRLAFYWSARYVHEFFLTWENLGNINSKNRIPAQFIQDFDVECSWLNGKYNLAFSVNNFTNARAYDNFNIQKPGIACSVKLRCFFLK